MKAEDKAKIMETLSTLTKSITKLQEEIKGVSASSTSRTVKTKAQVQTLTNYYSHSVMKMCEIDGCFLC